MHTALARLAVAHGAEQKQFLLSFRIPMCRWILYCLNLLPLKDKETTGGEGGGTRANGIHQTLSRLCYSSSAGYSVIKNDLIQVTNNTSKGVWILCVSP